MCFIFIFGEDEIVLGSRQAPGNCPSCGGTVMATDVERTWRLCCLPLCIKNKSKYSCSNCSRRLETYP